MNEKYYIITASDYGGIEIRTRLDKAGLEDFILQHENYEMVSPEDFQGEDMTFTIIKGKPCGFKKLIEITESEVEK